MGGLNPPDVMSYLALVSAPGSGAVAMPASPRYRMFVTYVPWYYSRVVHMFTYIARYKSGPRLLCRAIASTLQVLVKGLGVPECLIKPISGHK
jgi:hypothetical protein